MWCISRWHSATEGILISEWFWFYGTTARIDHTAPNTSLNGGVSAISILSGKVIDMEVVSQSCKKWDTKTSSFAQKHQCANQKGSSGDLEVIGAYRIFGRSVNSRGLVYSEYFGDGDSNGYDEVIIIMVQILS
ncbi:hypothetical protein AVEN_256218-1 [Araneus ventricosus]|uniref:Mutator-like transposase domain-containing protein n=1 Tax=Araneus ventricosus TaxID=182803 RepID=A0A4Y2LPQ0_ARAVE|nr:hypothetical protein AVEN_256218-1 [Araneus ventricosus]